MVTSSTTITLTPSTLAYHARALRELGRHIDADIGARLHAAVDFVAHRPDLLNAAEVQTCLAQALSALNALSRDLETTGQRVDRTAGRFASADAMPELPAGLVDRLGTGTASILDDERVKATGMGWSILATPGSLHGLSAVVAELRAERLLTFVNHADKEELSALGGIGPARARAILQARERAPITTTGALEAALAKVGGYPKSPAKRDRLLAGLAHRVDDRLKQRSVPVKLRDALFKGRAGRAEPFAAAVADERFPGPRRWTGLLSSARRAATGFLGRQMIATAAAGAMSPVGRVLDRPRVIKVADRALKLVGGAARGVRFVARGVPVVGDVVDGAGAIRTLVNPKNTSNPGSAGVERAMAGVALVGAGAGLAVVAGVAASAVAVVATVAGTVYLVYEGVGLVREHWDDIERGADRARDAVVDAADDVRDAAVDKVDDVREQAGKAVGAAADRVDDVGDKASDLAEKAKDKAKDLLRPRLPKPKLGFF